VVLGVVVVDVAAGVLGRRHGIFRLFGGQLLVERLTAGLLGDMVGRGPAVGRIDHLIAVVVANFVGVERLRRAKRVVHPAGVVRGVGEFRVNAIHV
jgi:hypothetical protein